MKTKIKELFLNEEKNGIALVAELVDGRTAKMQEALIGGQWILEWQIESFTCPACGQEMKTCGYAYSGCRHINGC